MKSLMLKSNVKHTTAPRKRVVNVYSMKTDDELMNATVAKLRNIKNLRQEREKARIDSLTTIHETVKGILQDEINYVRTLFTQCTNVEKKTDPREDVKETEEEPVKKSGQEDIEEAPSQEGNVFVDKI